VLFATIDDELHKDLSGFSQQKLDHVLYPTTALGLGWGTAMAAVAHGSTKYDNLPRDCPLRRMHLFNLNRLPGNSIDAMLDMSRPAPGMIVSLLYGLACTAITGLFMSFPIVLYALIAKPAGAVEASMTERLGSRLVIFGALAPITPITYFYDPVEMGATAEPCTRREGAPCR
jgi:hypothetical protein